MKQQDTLEQQLLAREKSYWNAIMSKDTATAERLSDDPCLVVGAQGVGELGHGALRKMLEGATYELNSYALDDVHFRVTPLPAFAPAAGEFRTSAASATTSSRSPTRSART